MTGIVDLNHCGLSRKNGMYGGAAGNKDGIVYEGEHWLVKYPKNIKGLERTGSQRGSAFSEEICRLSDLIYEAI